MGKVRRKRKRALNSASAENINKPFSRQEGEAKSLQGEKSKNLNAFKLAQQRRSDRRANFLDKLHTTQRTLKKEAEIKKTGKALGDIGSLSDILKEYSSKPKAVVKGGSSKQYQPPQQQKRMRNKTRQAILAKEVSLFSKVLNHPAFKEDPCKAVSEHLRNTFGTTSESESGH